MIPIAAPNWFIYPHSQFAQSSGFNRGYLGFGDTSGTYQRFNRTLSFSTYTETVQTIFATAARIQPATGASPSHIYLVKGYAATGISATVNKVSGLTSTEVVPTITFSVERRGAGGNPMVQFQKSRMYFCGGYSDSTGTYRTEVTYITQNTETTATVATLPAGRHMGGAFMTLTDGYTIGGYDSGGAASNTNYRYQFSNDTVTTGAGDSYNTQNATTFSSGIYGYRVQGVAMGSTTNTRYNFSTATWSASATTPESQYQVFGAGSYVNEYEGAVWGGYQSYLKRIVYRLAFSTETYTNSSYTTGDTNSGFLYYPGTY